MGGQEGAADQAKGEVEFRAPHKRVQNSTKDIAERFCAFGHSVSREDKAIDECRLLRKRWTLLMTKE